VVRVNLGGGETKKHLWASTKIGLK